MRITIGVPFYNVGELLLDCVRSVFAQSEQDWELLLVDDGSTDDSLEIARSLDDPRIRIISDGRNCGLPARLNQIAEMARGEYVARQDADDLMHRERLKLQAAYLEANAQVDAVGCPWIAINELSDVIGRSAPRKLDLRPESVLRRVPLSHGTVLARRDWLQRIPYSCELRRSQDRDFWIRAILVERSNVVLLDPPLYYYRIPSIVSTRKTLEGYRNNRRLLRKYGPCQLGKLRTFACLCESFGKTAIWKLATPTPAATWLSTARSVPLAESEHLRAQEMLDHIRMQPLPIISDMVDGRKVATFRFREDSHRQTLNAAMTRAHR